MRYVSWIFDIFFVMKFFKMDPNFSEEVFNRITHHHSTMRLCPLSRINGAFGPLELRSCAPYEMNEVLKLFLIVESILNGQIC